MLQDQLAIFFGYPNRSAGSNAIYMPMSISMYLYMTTVSDEPQIIVKNAKPQQVAASSPYDVLSIVVVVSDSCALPAAPIRKGRCS